MVQIVFQMKLSHVVIDIIVTQLTVYRVGRKFRSKSVSNCSIIFFWRIVLASAKTNFRMWGLWLLSLVMRQMKGLILVCITRLQTAVSAKKLHQKPMKWALKIKVIGEENWTSFLGFFSFKDKGVYIGTKWGLEFLLFIYRLQR